MTEKYAVEVTPKPSLHKPFDLGPYRWLWLARLRVKHYLRDELLRVSTLQVKISSRGQVIESYYPIFGGGSSCGYTVEREK